jgi:hypothetical protein
LNVANRRGDGFAAKRLAFGFSRAAADRSATTLGLFKRSRIPLWWAREVQHRDRETLLGQAPFEELDLKLVELGLEQALISIDIPKMGIQTRNSFAHNGDPHKTEF